MGKNDIVPLSQELTCLIALGSNLEFEGGGPAQLLDAAFLAIERRGLMIRAKSRYFNTPAFPAGSGPDFVNAAAVLDCSSDPEQTLAHLHDVEEEMGRVREVRWSARTLDLDLIAMGEHVLPDPQTHRFWRELPLEQQQITTPDRLILPHPRLSERAFVLVPLLDVAPDWIHPVTGLSVRQMHDALTPAQREEVVAL